MRCGLLALLVIALRGQACEATLPGEGAHRLEGERYVVAWRAEPTPLHVSEFFVVEVAACAKTGSGGPEELRVDAVMPEHKHGMNYRPTVTRIGAGRFHAQGLMLHMPGPWEIRFDLRGAAGNETVRERFLLR